MKVLFMTPYPRFEAPSQRFRFEQQINTLEANGIRCTFQPFWDERAWRVLHKPGRTLAKTAGFFRGWLRRLGVLCRLGGYDVVFVHREAAPVGPPLIEWVVAKVWRKKMIFDFDDAIWLSNVSQMNRFAGKLKWHRKVRSICKWSWKVSCGNEFLAEFARRFNDNVVVIPTTVDTDYYTPPQQKSGNPLPVIGWTGSLSTNRYVEALEPVLSALSTRAPFELLLISNQPPSLELPYTFVPWNKQTEVQDLLRIDVGLMPLNDDDWSRGKCGFKLIQYGALAIPSVASPVGANCDVVINGETGWWAGAPDDWIAALEKLLTDDTLRMKMGARSRAYIEERYSARSVSPLYLGLFQAGTG